ncbi:hypothetical protein, partial [Klebsiella pneumoniae]|uniref:hypothetical protein n=1 Tax=Klebsiella pneumoniae TaxID=573 RepID=UPI00385476A5
IRSAFLHHVHAGGSDHPSKIKLDTQVILTAFGPPGSPIFELLDSNGNPFSGKASDYGPPEVRLNNTVLPSSAYDLTTGNPWFIYLKNSL